MVGNKEVENNSHTMKLMGAFVAGAGLTVATVLLMKRRVEVKQGTMPALMDQCHRAADELDHRLSYQR